MAARSEWFPATSVASIYGMDHAPAITSQPKLLSAPRPAAARKQPARRRVLGELAHPGDIFRHLGPNWYTLIMGTGIVATAAVLLPVHTAALHAFALGVWVLAATLLVGLTLATAVHWFLYTETARGHHRNPAMAPFYGAPPMAMLTSAPERCSWAET